MPVSKNNRSAILFAVLFFYIVIGQIVVIQPGKYIFILVKFCVLTAAFLLHSDERLLLYDLYDPDQRQALFSLVLRNEI